MTWRSGVQLDTKEKIVAILGDRWWPQTAEEEGDNKMIIFLLLCDIWKEPTERPHVGGVSVESRNGVPSRNICVINGQMTKASNT